MSQIDNGSDVLRDQLTCSICLELYVDPKSLPCLHNFCKQCLQDHIDSSKGKSSSCPLCKKEISVKLSDQLPSNFIILEFLDIYKDALLKKENRAESQSLSFACDACDENEAALTHYCVDCELWLCNTCSKSHKKIKITRNHALKSNDVVRDEIAEKITTKINALESDKENFSHKVRALKEMSKLFDKTCNDRKSDMIRELRKIVNEKISNYQSITQNEISKKIEHLGAVVESLEEFTKDVHNKFDAADGRASQDLLELLTNRSLEESTSEDVDIEKITVPMAIKITESVKQKIFSVFDEMLMEDESEKDVGQSYLESQEASCSSKEGAAALITACLKHKSDILETPMSNITRARKSVILGDYIAQWPKKVLGFSSQYDQTRFAASHLPGPPSVYLSAHTNKAIQSTDGVWMTGNRDCDPWVELQFDYKVEVTEVRIWETFNAGGVVDISGRCEGNEASVFLSLWAKPGLKGEVLQIPRVFSPTLQHRCQTRVIRIQLDCYAGFIRQIDAVEVKGQLVM